MSLQRHSRSGSHRGIWIRAVLASVALFALLATRNVAPDFTKASCADSSISADSHHDQRPRFDDSGSKWNAPAGHLNYFLLLPNRHT